MYVGGGVLSLSNFSNFSHFLFFLTVYTTFETFFVPLLCHFFPTLFLTSDIFAIFLYFFMI